MPPSKTCVRVIVSGRVQGVGFRAWVHTKASQLGLDGWVRNRHDGTVEAVFSGDLDAVHLMLEACHLGSSSAIVDEVKSQLATATAIESGFHIKPNV
jgi:acylphosphatase